MTHRASVLIIRPSHPLIWQVGETILDPFGDDPEDYALLHFVEVTVCSSHEAIEIEPCGKRVRERESFYGAKELSAANELCKRMIRRRASQCLRLSVVVVDDDSSSPHSFLPPRTALSPTSVSRP